MTTPWEGQPGGEPPQPPPPAPPAPPSSVPQPTAYEQPWCYVGDIGVTQSEVILPGGQRVPLRGTTWIVSNNTTTTSGISTVGIVLCVIFVWLCLLGLLFLLIKEEKTTGYVQVAVQGQDFYYATQIGVSAPAHVVAVEQQVNAVRSLVAQLG